MGVALHKHRPGFDQRAYDDWINTTFQPVYDLLQRSPEQAPGIRHYAGFDTYDDLGIPLIAPNQWPKSFYTAELAIDSLRRPAAALFASAPLLSSQ